MILKCYESSPSTEATHETVHSMGWCPVPQQLITATAHHLVFHAGENDVQHLSKSSLGSGLIDEIFAGQIDIVTCPDRL